MSWAAITFERTMRPSSTTAMPVSSHDVSMPSTSISHVPVPRCLPRPRRPLVDLAGGRDAGGELLEAAVVGGGAQALGPHDQGVLAGLGVVVLADADRGEAELLVEGLGGVVGDADLQRAGAGATP